MAHKPCKAAGFSFVPKSPLFLPSICLPINTRKWKNGKNKKRGRPGSIHRVNDVRWTRSGCRREGPNCQNNALDHPFECSITGCTPDLSVNETTCLASKFSAYISAPPFLRPPHNHLCDECSQAFPAFCRSSAPDYYCEQKVKTEKV